MRLTKISSRRVGYYQSFEQIPNDYGWGRRYKKDPLNGKLDYLTHPSKLAHNAAYELDFGDCDDHAIFWCTALLKNKLATHAWFCFYSMEKEADASLSAHAVCVFRAASNGVYYLCDYNLPTNLGEQPTGWMQESAKGYGAVPLIGAMIKVSWIQPDDTPVFGEITILEP